MNKISKEVRLSKEFKAQTTKAVLSVLCFVIAYILILAVALLITSIFLFSGIALITFKPSFITIALGLGLSSIGGLILIFLLKFIFKSHKIDRSHLVEIKEQDEPELFKMINEIVHEVGTSFPKKVYIAPDVNAMVFYDSSFWSMFFPVRKNLQIGLGLVNTVSKQELKAILAHEFGHFSQTTMKVGSYVYNLNQIIYNMLYENDSFDKVVQYWARINAFFTLCVELAVFITEVIQKILKSLYEVVNVSYMGLSREMEFHADEIAARVTGYLPLKKSLLRSSIADTSFNEVLNFYSGKVHENLKSRNVYSDQTAVLCYIAEENNLNINNGLPDISIEELSKFDKSKLVVKDQWASHPSTQDRIDRLESTGLISNVISDTPANTIFRDIEALQRRITLQIFESIDYQEEAAFVDAEKFITLYKEQAKFNSFPKIYNGYYDFKNPVSFEVNNFEFSDEKLNFDDLYSNEMVDLVCVVVALENDIQLLENISNKTLQVKSFDYDGFKYKQDKAGELVEKLKLELAEADEIIAQNDRRIYQFFKQLDVQKSKLNDLDKHYNELFAFDKEYTELYQIFIDIQVELQFVSVKTPFYQIEYNFHHIQGIEEELKKEIRELLQDPILQDEITFDVKENLNKYLSRQWIYFVYDSYDDGNLAILYTALNNFVYLISRKYFLIKKALLEYQECLVRQYHN